MVKEMKQLDAFLPNALSDVLENLDKERTPLKITTVRRAYGKKVTLISGFDKTTNVKKIAKLLKSRCATGGTIKENIIELQGDQIRRATEILEKEGYQILII